jgi:hypothetical protein
LLAEFARLEGKQAQLQQRRQGTQQERRKVNAQRRRHSRQETHAVYAMLRQAPEGVADTPKTQKNDAMMTRKGRRYIEGRLLPHRY